MPILKNPKHELFAQELANGKTQIESYGLAGFNPHRGNASVLAQDQNIVARVHEILLERQAIQDQGVAEAVERTGVTVEGLLEELEEARQKADSQDNGAGAMVQATLGKAKLCGMIIEKKEDVTPRRRVEEIDARIRKFLEPGGEDRATGASGGARAGAERDQTFPTVPGHGTA